MAGRAARGALLLVLLGQRRGSRQCAEQWRGFQCFVHHCGAAPFAQIVAAAGRRVEAPIVQHTDGAEVRVAAIVGRVRWGVVDTILESARRVGDEGGGRGGGGGRVAVAVATTAAADGRQSCHHGPFASRGRTQRSGSAHEHVCESIKAVMRFSLVGIYCKRGVVRFLANVCQILSIDLLF